MKNKLLQLEMIKQSLHKKLTKIENEITKIKEGIAND